MKAKNVRANTNAFIPLPFRHLGPRLLLILLILCPLCVGCDSSRIKTYRTSGKVVFEDGSPVHVGSIELRSKEHGVQARGQIEKDGSFRLTTYKRGDGAVSGEHEVVVVQLIVAEQMKQHHHGTRGIVNPKHSSYATSGLVCQIPKGGTSDLTITVTGVEELETSTPLATPAPE